MWMKGRTYSMLCSRVFRHCFNSPECALVAVYFNLKQGVMINSAVSLNWME